MINIIRAINEEIRTKNVRIVGEIGQSDEILDIEDALKTAYDSDLDLVLVGENNGIGICKIINYSKYLYKAQKIEKAKHKNKIKIKEVRIGCSIADNDVVTKAKTVDRLLEENDRVKIRVIYKGREMSRIKEGFTKLKMITAMVNHSFKIEKEAKIEGNSVNMIISTK